MRKVFIWFWISCKRQSKRPGFLILLLLLPILLYGFRQLEKKDTEGIAIAVYVEEQQGLSQEIADALIKKDGMFRFYQCTSKEEMMDEVASRRAECGYLFYQGLEEKLDRQDMKRCIGVYSAPSTVADALSTEVVFSVLFEVYGKDLLENFTRGNQIFASLDQEEAWDEMELLYEKYRSNGSTFSFAYEYLAETVDADVSSPAVFPIRGMIAVTIFVTGLFSAVMLCEDEAKGLFIPLSYAQKPWCALSSMMAPVFLTGISGLVAIYITGNFSFGFFYEFFMIFGYVLFVVLLAYGLKQVIRNSVVLCSLIPFLAMGSLVLCPVFFDISNWVPGIGALGKWFPPYYYMALFR